MNERSDPEQWAAAQPPRGDTNGPVRENPACWAPGMLVLCLLLATAAVLIRGDARAAPPLKKRAVTLIIDYDDGVEKRFTAIAWRREMTVLDAMDIARKHPRGIKFAYHGSGPTGLLTGIDDLKNQGAGGRNWNYRVGGKVADRSFAIYKLKASDTVLWKFGKFR